MSVKEPEIFKIIDKIKEHFNTNIVNRFVRKALLTMQVTKSTWDILDTLKEKADYHKIQGYQFDELYDIIIAAATFIYHARKEVMPNLKSRLIGGPKTVFSKEKSGQADDRVLTEMAINNFPVNLKIFSDMINMLYMKTVEIDKNENKQRPVYERIPELKQLGEFLVDK
jgi:hypothetical protein